MSHSFVKRNIKIVHVISSLAKGGAERLVVDLCNEFSENANNIVYLLVFNEISNQPSFKSELGNRVNYISLNKKNRIDFIFQFRLLVQLSKIKPDIINSHLSGTILYLYIPMMFLRKIKYFHTVHNLAEEEVPSKFLQLVRKIFYRTGLVSPVSISEATNVSNRRMYGIDSVVIYNGIKRRDTTLKLESTKKEIDSYKINNETKVFISVGRINSPKDQKNFILLIDVFTKLFTNHYNVILIIIGADTSTDKTTLMNLLKNKSTNTFLVGSKDNVKDFLTNSNYYCLSSKFEGLPITVIEALESGIPIIASNVGALSEMIENEVNGLLVDSLTVEAYYAKIIELLKWNNDKLFQTKTNNVNKFESHFSIELASNKYMNLYKNKLTSQIN